WGLTLDMAAGVVETWDVCDDSSTTRRGPAVVVATTVYFEHSGVRPGTWPLGLSAWARRFRRHNIQTMGISCRCWKAATPGESKEFAVGWARVGSQVRGRRSARGIGPLDRARQRGRRDDHR